MYETVAFAKLSSDTPFQRLTIMRRSTSDDDVEIDVKFCGICHTDVHFALNEMGNTRYPIVPGHELAGVVTKVGRSVTKFSVGDRAGVGCIVDSCLSCAPCEEGDEVGCETGFTSTYNDEPKHGRILTDAGHTFGGYSDRISVHQHFAIRIPAGYPLEAAGPIFCAGISTFTPLKRFGAVGGGRRVGVVGIGGMGQMGVRLAVAMGNDVTAISSSPAKEAVARKIGAKSFVVSSDEEAMKKAEGSLDLILNTISADHQASHYLPLLARKGTMVQLGVVPNPHSVSQLPLMFGQTSLSGSLIGGLCDTQACMDFCAEHNIAVDVELVTWDRLQEVYDRLRGSNDRAVRYVLDLEKSLGRK